MWPFCFCINVFNTSPPRSAYMRHWTRSALVQVMACRLFGAKPLHKPMLIYCQLGPWEQTSMKFASKYKTFHIWNCKWKCRLRNGGHFVQGGWVKSNELTVHIVVGNHQEIHTEAFSKIYYPIGFVLELRVRVCRGDSVDSIAGYGRVGVCRTLECWSVESQIS